MCHCICPHRDDDMISLASMMSISNLSTIGFLEDEEDDYNYWSVRPPLVCTLSFYVYESSAGSASTINPKPREKPSQCLFRQTYSWCQTLRTSGGRLKTSFVLGIGTVHRTVGPQSANTRALYTLHSVVLVLSTMVIIFIHVHAL